MDRAMATGVPSKDARIDPMVGTHVGEVGHPSQPESTIPGEAHFNCSNEALSVQELALWLSRFVEVRREDGKCYPPNS